MASPQTWLELIAWTKALFDATKAAIDLTSTYQKYRNDPETIKEAERVSAVYSTYDDGEVKMLSDRMKNCKSIFASEGGAEQRVKCLCNVLIEAKNGNGGDLPEIGDWVTIYSQLKCRTLERASVPNNA